eukprot:TRINITY_DN4539_c0_g1_i2.p1 TRINITY_DN4539_c0_g1~~TRINITY_DN4539_c0_g1_i2.p1  ORF type:complete len:538 (+),score=119.77 TRINITY_DN4539_c0_g1_i2:341-1954(+)
MQKKLQKQQKTKQFQKRMLKMLKLQMQKLLKILNHQKNQIKLKKQQLKAQKRIIKLQNKIKIKKTSNKVTTKKKTVKANVKKTTKIAKNKIVSEKSTKNVKTENTKDSKSVSQQLIKNNEVIITEPSSQEQQNNLKLENKEFDLDNKVRNLERTCDQTLNTYKNLDNQRINIESNLQKLQIEEDQILDEKNSLLKQQLDIDNELQRCKQIMSNATINQNNSYSQQICLKNNDQFQEKQIQLVREISAYDQLFKELHEEKIKFENQKNQLYGITQTSLKKKEQNNVLPLVGKSNKLETEPTTIINTEHYNSNSVIEPNYYNSELIKTTIDNQKSSPLTEPYYSSYHNYGNYNTEPDQLITQDHYFDINLMQQSNETKHLTLLAEVKQQVEREALWNTLHKQLEIVNDLGQTNAKQQRLWENQIQKMKNDDPKHQQFMNSLKYIQMETGAITSKLNLMLSQQPENKDQIKLMTKNIVDDIDRLYDLTKKQNKLIGASQILQSKEQKLLQMKTNCVDVEHMLKNSQLVMKRNAKKVLRVQ